MGRGFVKVATDVLAPWIGAVSDASGRRKPWVVGLTLACVGATLALSLLARAPLPGPAAIALLLAVFAAANTAYQLALPPYSLPGSTSPRRTEQEVTTRHGGRGRVDRGRFLVALVIRHGHPAGGWGVLRADARSSCCSLSLFVGATTSRGAFARCVRLRIAGELSAAFRQRYPACRS
jgi:hypothetical protein